MTLVAENAQPQDAGRGLLSLPLGDVLSSVLFLMFFFVYIPVKLHRALTISLAV